MDLENRVGWILSQQRTASIADVQPLHQAVAIHEGDDDVSVPGLDRPVDHQDVPVEDLGTLHGVALDRKEKGRDRIGDQIFVDVESAFLVVGRRRREAGRYLHSIDRESLRRGKNISLRVFLPSIGLV